MVVGASLVRSFKDGRSSELLRRRARASYVLSLGGARPAPAIIGADIALGSSLQLANLGADIALGGARPAPATIFTLTIFTFLGLTLLVLA